MFVLGGVQDTGLCAKSKVEGGRYFHLIGHVSRPVSLRTPPVGPKPHRRELTRSVASIFKCERSDLTLAGGFYVIIETVA